MATWKRWRCRENVSTSARFPDVAFRADQKRFHVERQRPTWKRFWGIGPTWKRFPVREVVKRFHVRHHVRRSEYPENMVTWRRLHATENVSTSAVLCAGRSAQKWNVSSVIPASGFSGSLNGSASWSEAATTHTPERPTGVKRVGEKKKVGSSTCSLQFIDRG